VRGSLAIDRKRQGAPDRGTWTGVRGSFRLEQVQHPLGAIGSPMRDEATVVCAQRYVVGFSIAVLQKHCFTG
jgi:hypothetical protein